jgi:hypothetical protein
MTCPQGEAAIQAAKSGGRVIKRMNSRLPSLTEIGSTKRRGLSAVVPHHGRSPRQRRLRSGVIRLKAEDLSAMKKRLNTNYHLAVTELV